MPLVWRPVIVPNPQGTQVYYTSHWASPLFDLRPELRGTGQNVPGGVKIWRQGYGAGCRLWVQVEGVNQGGVLSGTAARGLRVFAQEFGHIYDSQRVQSMTPLVDVSRDFANNADRQSVPLQFYPLGDGYPIRFWRIEITFQKIVNEDPRPPGIALTVGGAYY